MDCGCFPTVENRSRLVLLDGGDLQKSARAAAVTGAAGGQLVDVACMPGTHDPIDAILHYSA